jgi:hypothetical protein
MLADDCSNGIHLLVWKGVSGKYSELKNFMLLVGADLSKFYLFSVVYNLTAT